MRKCTYPGCNVLVKRGRCPAHSTKRIVRDPDVKKLYDSQRWSVMRANQLSREPWCVECLKRGEHVFAKEVDHIQPHRGDPALFYDEINLQSLCKPDHSRKTANEVW
jgi:5-methylcytosine-specific restriction protein A